MLGRSLPLQREIILNPNYYIIANKHATSSKKLLGALLALLLVTRASLLGALLDITTSNKSVQKEKERKSGSRTKPRIQ